MRYRQRGRAVVLSDDQRLYFVRQWLNDSRIGGVGLILASLDRVEPDDYLDACLEIGDCSRKISLDLGINDSRDRANTLAKLDILIDAMTGLRENLFRCAVARARFERDQAREKAKEEAKEEERSGEVDAVAVQAGG